MSRKMRLKMQLLAMRIAPLRIALHLAFFAGASAALLFATLVATSLLFAPAFAQNSPQPPVLSAHARLMAARSIFIEHSGARLPNDVIGDAFQGWGRYTVADEPAQADLIVSISAPLLDSGPIASSGGGSGRRSSPSASSSRNSSSSSVTQIRLLILDAHDRVVLWSGTEQPKSAIKERQHEDNVIDASLLLFRRFRKIIEPEPAP